MPPPDNGPYVCPDCGVEDFTPRAISERTCRYCECTPLSREELSGRHDVLTKIIGRIEEIYETFEVEGASDEQRRRWLRTMLYREVFQ